MNTSIKKLLPLSILAVFSVLFHSSSSAQTKDDNTTLLDLGGSWIGGVAPTSSTIADWSGAYNTAGSLSAAFTASTPVSWQGISVGNISGTAAGLISIGGTGAAITGSSVTIGSSGINMSAANQNLVINSATTVLNGSQSWNIASGRNLRFGTNGGTGANANVDGSGTITISGGGLVDANQGGALGFADAAGYAGFSGKWVVGSGTTLRGLRHGATAWGTDTAADTITLNGGTLTTGGITGAVGNWHWTSNITASAGSTIDNQNISGSNRWLKLSGVITAVNGLTFASTGAGTMSADNGFILAGANSISGAVNINSGVFVRLGGLGGTDITTGVGSAGDLGTATIVNNGTLTLSRNNTWTFANDVSGNGVLRVGVTTGSATHIVTVSGNNSHSGGTTLQSAVTLNIGSANALGAGTFTIAGSGIFDNTTGSPLTVANAMTLSGGSPTFIGTNNMTINGPVTLAVANRTITVNNNTLALGGNIGQDASPRNLTKAGGGTLIVSGTNTYAGTTNINAGTFVLDGSHATGGAYTVAAGATLRGSGSTTSAVTVNGTGTLGPGNSVESLATGALTMASGSIFQFEGDSGHVQLADLLKADGALSLTNVTLNTTGLDSIWSVGAKFTLISYIDGASGITSGFAGFNDDTDYNFGGTNLWSLNYNDTVAGTNFNAEAISGGATHFVTITAVPEPTSLWLVGSLGLVLLRRRRV